MPKASDPEPAPHDRQRLDEVFHSRMDRLRMRHLRLLDGVARSGSLSGAADAIGMSQPGATSSNFACFYSASTLDNYNTINNNVISGGYYAIYNYGSSSTSREINNAVSNNMITDFYNYGIYSYYQTSPLIYKNTIKKIRV